MGLEFAGNNLCPNRPITSGNRRYPETDMARRRKKFDPNPRYKAENVVSLELEKPESVTKNYDAAAFDHCVNAAFKAALTADDESDVVVSAGPENLPDPYLSYNMDETGGRQEDSGRRSSTSSRPHSSARRSSKSRSSKRPGTASRSGRGSRSSRSSFDANDAISRSIRGDFDEEK